MKARPVLLGLLAAPLLCGAANIDRSTLTEVVNSVRVIEPATKKSSTAKVNTEFFAPNVLRTGADSRAEMIAPDQTVTRVGQNTVFSFSRDTREIELQKGSILFQSPTGKGGGTIRTPAASAAVLGTTLIVCATQNGGFKALLVEGNGRVKGAGGAIRNLNSGQMVYVLPGGKLSGIFEFRLSQQVAASNLVSGFKKKIPSAGKIQAAIDKQERDLAQGRALDTGLLASGSPSIAYKVDVARDTIVEEQGVTTTAQGPTRFQTATSSEALVNTPTLDATRVFLPEDVDPIEFPGDSRPLLVGPDGADGIVRRASNPAQFISQNITFETPNISLTSFAGRDVVQFLALENIGFHQSLDFGSFDAPIQLWAGGVIQTSEGTPVLLSAAAPLLTLVSFGDSFSTSEPLPTSLAEISTKVPVILTAFSVQNTAGALAIAGGSVQLIGTRLLADTDLRVAAIADLSITASTSVLAPAVAAPTPNFPAQASALFAKDLVDLRAGRDLTLVGTVINSPKIQMNAEGNTTLTLVQLNDLTPAGASVVGTPPPNVAIKTSNRLNLTAVNIDSRAVAMSARTINLTNVRFRQGSRVVLESAVGRLAANPNQNNPSVPGFVNFINNVRYGDSPAENVVTEVPPGANPPGSGIIIRPRK
jgi:hypothetical protein